MILELLWSILKICLFILCIWKMWLSLILDLQPASLLEQTFLLDFLNKVSNCLFWCFLLHVCFKTVFWFSIFFFCFFLEISPRASLIRSSLNYLLLCVNSELQLQRIEFRRRLSYHCHHSCSTACLLPHKGLEVSLPKIWNWYGATNTCVLISMSNLGKALMMALLVIN